MELAMISNFGNISSFWGESNYFLTKASLQQKDKELFKSSKLNICQILVYVCKETINPDEIYSKIYDI